MRLVLLASAFTLVLAAPAAAEKKPWRIDRVWNDTQAATVPVSPGASAQTSGTISAFGKLTLQTGCNTVWARGWLSGKKISFGKPWSTKKACNGEAQVIEAGVLKALSLAAIYERVEKNRTVLRDAQGREVLALAR